MPGCLLSDPNIVQQTSSISSHISLHSSDRDKKVTAKQANAQHVGVMRVVRRVVLILTTEIMTLGLGLQLTGMALDSHREAQT